MIRNIILNLQLACKKKNKLPSKKNFIIWLYSASIIFNKKIEINIRLVDEIEIYKLNMIYCGKNYPTNILSFKFATFPEIKSFLLGDLIICSKIVEKEAKNKNKELKEHWAHIVIHGLLHLLGYNHLCNKELIQMQYLESKIMIYLGYSDPYFYLIK